MASNIDAASSEANMPKAADLAAVWTDVFANGMEAVRSAARRGQQPKSLPYDATAPARAVADFVYAMLSNPLQLIDAQRRIGEEWIDLWRAVGVNPAGERREPLLAPQKGDRRFNDPAWTKQPLFDFLKQAYLLTTRQTLDMVASSDLDPATRTRVDFYARQFLNAISPANFAFSNPEAIRRALDTGGVSLLSGLANMLADAAAPGGLVKRRSADDFEIGVTIAATPGSVIFQNELMQLIQYAPATPTVHRRPLLYIPPLVNKYYILDLQAKSSMVKWLVDQGHSVFVVSWIDPGPELADKGLSDYVKHGPVAALDAIETITGERVADVFGFCMGGTLLAITAGYLAAIGQADRLGSVTMIGTLLDFSQTGEWSTFYEAGHMQAFERHLDRNGVIDAEQLQALFSVVRANDLIWSSVVNHYLLDRVAPASDLLFWFADGARIPKAFLLDYARLLLSGNRLREPGGIAIAGTPIELARVEAPVMMISLKDDHVSGWEATYEGLRLFGGETRFLLGGSGHNAGLINPPSANKHGYWTNDAVPDDAAAWLADAARNEGSWWPRWQQWLISRHEAEMVPARIPGDGPLPVLEPAPGSYVKGV